MLTNAFVLDFTLSHRPHDAAGCSVAQHLELTPRTAEFETLTDEKQLVRCLWARRNATDERTCIDGVIWHNVRDDSVNNGSLIARFPQPRLDMDTAYLPRGVQPICPNLSISHSLHRNVNLSHTLRKSARTSACDYVDALPSIRDIHVHRLLSECVCVTMLWWRLSFVKCDGMELDKLLTAWRRGYTGHHYNILSVIMGVDHGGRAWRTSPPPQNLEGDANANCPPPDFVI